MHSDVFSVIADPTRRRIVRILAEQTHTVGAVVEKLGMSQPTISKHLKVLRDADVVSVTVEGQRRLYSLNPEVFATVTEWINETVQIALRASEAPVALPGGATLSSERAPDEKAEVAPTSVTEPGSRRLPRRSPSLRRLKPPRKSPQSSPLLRLSPLQRSWNRNESVAPAPSILPRPRASSPARRIRSPPMHHPRSRKCSHSGC